MFRKLAKKMQKKKLTPDDVFGKQIKSGKLKSNHFYHCI